MKRNWKESDPRRDALNKAGSSLGKWLKKLSTGYFNYTPPKSGSHWTKENPEFKETQSLSLTGLLKRTKYNYRNMGKK